MKKMILASMSILATSLVVPASASAGSDDVVVEAPWVRASIGMSRPGAADMTVRNTGEMVTLSGLVTPMAMMPEIHLGENGFVTTGKDLSGGAPVQAYDVFLFRADGSTEIFANYLGN